MNLSKLDEVRAKIAMLNDSTNAKDFIKSAVSNKILEKILGSDLELDGTALLAVSSRRFADSTEIWRFYQEIVERSAGRPESAFVIAEACSYINPKTSHIIFNIVRLLFLSANSLVLNSFEGHSDLRLSCARVLIKIDEIDQAALFLESLAFLISDNDERAREQPYITENRQFLQDLVEKGANERVREAARSVIVASRI